MQKHVNLVYLVKSFPTNIYLQNLASIQKRTSPVKFAHLAEKSGKGSISNLSTKLPAREQDAPVVPLEEPDDRAEVLRVDDEPGDADGRENRWQLQNDPSEEEEWVAASEGDRNFRLDVSEHLTRFRLDCDLWR